MAQKIITLTRHQLFKKIWESPIQVVAKEFQMSDVGLAKICRRHNIPRPPRGHWRKKETGKKYQTSRFPPDRDGYESVIRITIDENLHNRLKSASDYKNSIKQHVVEVDSTNEYKHPITLKTYYYLNKSKTSQNGILIHKTYPINHIHVSPRSLSRALRVLDAILLSLELNQFKVSWKSAHNEIEATKDEIAISFKIHEKIAVDEVDIPSRIKPGNNQHTSDRPRYNYNPTGKLIFYLDKFYCASGIRALWTDSKYKNLEYYVPDIIANFLLTVDVVNEYDRLAIAKEIRDVIDYAKRHQLEINKHIFNNKMEYILKIYEKWEKFSTFCKFVEELSSNMYGFHFENNITDTHNELLKMAEHHAKQLDPFQDMKELFENFKKKNNFTGGYY